MVKYTAIIFDDKCTHIGCSLVRYTTHDDQLLQMWLSVRQTASVDKYLARSSDGYTAADQ